MNAATGASDAAGGLLAIDTSTERLAVALWRQGRAHLHEGAGGPLASAALLPAVHALVAASGGTLRDVTQLAFGQGPGAFTGLRTSCAVAQGLAFGLGCPVLPLDSLLIVAEQVLATGALAPSATLGVVMDARMGEAYAGRYRWSGERWQVLQPPALWTLAALVDDWSAHPPAVCAGSGLQPFDAALAQACPQATRVDVGDTRAAALLALARRVAQVQTGVDPADALPLYLRDKVAQTTAERDAARAAVRA